MTASPEVRAQRRYLERQGRGEPATYEAVLADIRRRDERDAGRDAAPMRPAADAVLLDTCNLDIEAAFDTAVGVIIEEGRPTRARLRAGSNPSWQQGIAGGELKHHGHGLGAWRAQHAVRGIAGSRSIRRPDPRQRTDEQEQE